MICQHRQSLTEYTINGVQDGLLLITCPDCHSTIVYRGEYQTTDVTTMLTDVALALTERTVDLIACSLIVDTLIDQAKTELDKVFATSLRTRIETRLELLKGAI